MADTELTGPARRLAALRGLMGERGYDAVLVRDEANLRWLTGATGVFDYTGEYPHAAFITHDGCWLHTDSRYFNSFEENLPAGHPWTLDMDETGIPAWAAALEPAEALEAHLRAWRVPILGRIHRGKLLLDVRTLLPGDEAEIAAALAAWREGTA